MNNSNELAPNAAAQNLAELAETAHRQSPALPGQNAVVTITEAACLELSAPQQAAIVKLTAGYTRREAAEAAGVTRSTLYRWMNHDAQFQAAFNAWQRDVISTTQAQLLAAAQDAVGTVVKAIRAGDAKLAWELLKTQGIAARLHPGSTDAAELQQKQAMDRKKTEIAQRKQRGQIEMDDLLAR